MRIEEINLRAFGPFTDLNLIFKKQDRDFHVLYGSNEAGKSSALRALRSLFFGIPHHSTDNFLHENAKLRIAGRISHSDGSSVPFIRRKGNKNTLLDFNEKVLDDSVLSKFLQGVDEGLFTVLFGIDHDGLTRGAQNILQEGGELGQSLFSAGMGGADLKKILQELDDEASALFRPKGQVQTVNRAINEYAECKRIVSEASLPGRKWLENNRELKRTLRDRGDITKKIKEFHREKSRLERLRHSLPDIARRTKWMSELAEIGDVAVVDDDFGKKRKEYQDQLRVSTEIKERASRELEKLKEAVERIIIPGGLLDQAVIISDLYQRLGSHRKGLLDRGRLQGNIHQLSVDIEAILSEIMPDADIKEYVKLRPNVALRAKIHGLGSQHQALVEALDRANKDIVKSEKALTKAKSDLQLLAARQEIDTLKSAFLRVQKRGDLSLSLNEVLKDIKSEEEQIQLDIKKLPLWSGTIEELENIPVPASETIDRFESALQDITSKMVAIDEKEKEIRSELSLIEHKIEALRIAGAVPTEDELLQSREKREQGWHLVLRSWIGREDVGDAASAFDAEEELPQAYQKSVIRADELADRLRREADRVAKNANFIVQLNGLQANLNEIEQNREDLKTQLSTTELQWSSHWKSTGMDPMPPREMRAWIVRQNTILQRLEKLRGLRYRCERITEQIEEHKKELTMYLRDLGREPSTTEGYDAFLSHCQSVIESAEDTNRKRTDLEEKISQYEDDMKTNQQKRDALDKKFRQWQSDWKAAVSTLRLTQEASPAEAYAVIDKFDELFKKVDEKTSIEKRIAGIDRDAGIFSSDVKSLVKKVAPELGDLPIEQAVAEMNGLLNKANEDSATHAALRKQLNKEEKTLREAEETIKIALKQLDGLCVSAGCSKHEELEEIERRSLRKKSIQEKIETIENELLEIGGGLSLDELIKETEDVDGDSLPGMISEIENQLTNTESGLSELDQKIGGIQTVLSQMDGNAKAAEAAEQSQQVLSTIRESVERYIHLRMCSIVLQREIERYRSENQDPLLQRAGQLFSVLTMRSFTSLKNDFDDKDKPILVGVRPTGEVVGVEGMSDGTLDQLYLALRLASLEKFLDANEPMPFIVDDILIRFDDERAKAALKTLADLSKKTQILFFTHHTRLVELVEKEAICENAGIHSL